MPQDAVYFGANVRDPGLRMGSSMARMNAAMARLVSMPAGGEATLATTE